MRRYLAARAAPAYWPARGGGRAERDPARGARPLARPRRARTPSPASGRSGLVQAADGTVWAAWPQSDAIAPLRERRRPPGAPVAVGRTRRCGSRELDGSLWVTTIRDGGRRRGRPARPAASRRTVDLGEQPEGLTALDGHLCVVLQETRALVEVDPATARCCARYDVGGEPRLVGTRRRRALRRRLRGRPAWCECTPGARGKVAAQQAGLRRRAGPAGRSTDGVGRLHDGRRRSSRWTRETLAASRDRTDVEGDPDGLSPGPGGALLVSAQDGPASRWSTPRPVRSRRVHRHARPARRQRRTTTCGRGHRVLSDYTGNRSSRRAARSRRRYGTRQACRPWRCVRARRRVMIRAVSDTWTEITDRGRAARRCSARLGGRRPQGAPAAARAGPRLDRGVAVPADGDRGAPTAAATCRRRATRPASCTCSTTRRSRSPSGPGNRRADGWRQRAVQPARRPDLPGARPRSTRCASTAGPGWCARRRSSTTWWSRATGRCSPWSSRSSRSSTTAARRSCGPGCGTRSLGRRRPAAPRGHRAHPGAAGRPTSPSSTRTTARRTPNGLYRQTYDARRSSTPA